MRWGIAWLALACGCSSSSQAPDDESPTCGTPPALTVPIATARTGEPLHWRSDRCIDVTYAALSDVQVADLDYAIAVWSAVGCRSLCFAGPTESDAPLQGADGRLHVT